MPTWGLAGANYFECGKPFLRSTLAYLWGNATAEWSYSITACVFVPIAVLSVEQIRVAALNIPLAVQRDQVKQGVRSFVVLPLVVFGWMLCTAILSIPSLVYTAATSLPPDNTLGLGVVTLQIFEGGGGAILYLVSARIVPVLSRWASHLVDGGARLSCNVIMTTRLVISLIVPFCAVVMMNQDCFAHWLWFWNPCKDNSSEQFNVVWAQPTGYCTSSAAECNSWSNDFVQTGTFNTTIVEHSEVCRPDYIADGRCPRAAISVVGSLMVSKLTFAAFVAPGISLLSWTPFAQKMRTWIMRKVFCKPEDYEPRVSLDAEVASVVMLLEIPLVLGLCVPLLVPLACAACAAHTAVFHYAGKSLEHISRPSALYLWFSIVLGYGLQAWFFYESPEMHGRWLFIFGVPVVALSTLVALWVQQERRVVRRDGIAVPLLSDNSLPACGTSNNQEAAFVEPSARPRAATNYLDCEQGPIGVGLLDALDNPIDLDFEGPRASVFLETVWPQSEV